MIYAERLNHSVQLVANSLGTDSTTSPLHVSLSGEKWRYSMGKFIDLTGQRFGMLTVIGQGESRVIGKRKVAKSYWKCQCDCGNIKEICGDNLRNGLTNSCGCQVRKSVIIRSTKHGFSKRGKNRSRIYKIWAKMKGRCENESDQSYMHYGARGICVCDEWHDFLTFKDWAFSNGYSDDLTIDRIDVNGNYEPDNCRWVGMDVQLSNQRTTIKITLGNVTHSLKKWCELLNLNYTTVQARRRKGMDIYKAMFSPIICTTKGKL